VHTRSRGALRPLVAPRLRREPAGGLYRGGSRLRRAEGA
jgi:hypothetical protein